MNAHHSYSGTKMFTSEEIRTEFRENFPDWIDWDEDSNLPDVKQGLVYMDGVVTLLQLEMLVYLMAAK